ncbi:MAG: hypothetical protein ACLRZG_06855 [Streptococcus sp.]
MQSKVILTDHNEFQQSVSDIAAEVEVCGVVDHHRVANTLKRQVHFTCVWNQLDQHLLLYTACSKNTV